MNGFSLWVGFGAALGLWRLARSAPPQKAGVWVNTGLFVMLLTLTGARLFYVLINRPYFAKHLLETPQLWLGGLSWSGAVAGAWLAVLILALINQSSRHNRLNLEQIGDLLYPLLPPVAISAWLGCWAVGCAYGRPLPAGTWWGAPSLDESRFYTLHWPLQPLAALSLLLFFGVLEAKVKAFQPPGRLSGLANIGLLVSLLVTSFLRADPAPSWYGLRVDTWMAILYLACLILYLGLNHLVLRIRKKHSFLNP